MYGGNTACVVIESDGQEPIILDLGTGLRFFGLTRPSNEPFHGTALLSHLHWDHVQGIPFFTPLLREGSSLDIYGPPQDQSSLEEKVRSFIHPPYFPVGIDDLSGRFVFHEVLTGSFTVGRAVVTAAPVPHTGLTLGFRVEIDGRTVAYVTDHQEPVGHPTRVDPVVLDLARGADVLIHDAQFTRPEFDLKATWGHCTYEYAVEVAAQAGVDSLVLYHHDPEHADAELDRILEESRRLARGRGIGRVLSASEGMVMELGS